MSSILRLEARQELVEDIEGGSSLLDFCSYGHGHRYAGLVCTLAATARGLLIWATLVLPAYKKNEGDR